MLRYRLTTKQYDFQLQARAAYLLECINWREKRKLNRAYLDDPSVNKSPVPRDFAKVPTLFKVCPICQTGALKPIWDDTGHIYINYRCNSCQAEMSCTDYNLLPEES